MVQIMRSKSSIKEEGEEKQTFTLYSISKKVPQSRRDATILHSSEKNPKLLRN